MGKRKHQACLVLIFSPAFDNSAFAPANLGLHPPNRYNAHFDIIYRFNCG